MHVRFYQFELLFVCFCNEEGYFESIYPNPANSWSEILAQYALCITPNVLFVLFLLSALFLLPFFSSAEVRAAHYLYAGACYYKTVVPLETVNF